MRVDKPDEWEITDATELGQKVMETLFGSTTGSSAESGVLREMDEEASAALKILNLSAPATKMPPKRHLAFE